MPLQATSGAASYDAFGGGVPVVPNYIEEVFSTYLYTSTGSNQTITNGIDLSTKGGLVWVKGRNAVKDNVLVDTLRGVSNSIVSNTTDAQDFSSGNYVNAFSTTGFGVSGIGAVGGTNNTFATWTFRKQPKFFDVVTWTGDETGARTLSHNLGSVPGCIIVKRYEGDPQSWEVYHQSLGNTQGLHLDLTNAASTWSGYWNNTSPTATQFTVGANKNAGGSPTSRYVAYLFAHNAGGFGLTGTDNVISCGSYTGNGSADGPSINLGYEAQYVLIKRTDNPASWYCQDNMRGMSQTQTSLLVPNTSDAESAGSLYVSATATGFKINSSFSGFNSSSATYIYIAIRRGPMKVPTSGTSVFAPFYASYSEGAAITTNFPIDLSMWKGDVTYNWSWQDRLRGTPTSTGSGGPALASNSTAAETTSYTAVGITKLDSNTRGSVSYQADSGRSNAAAYFMLRRAPSFFDEVCYTGVGGTATFSHNLTVIPELLIIKRRSGVSSWPTLYNFVGSTFNKLQGLNQDGGAATNTYTDGAGLGGAPTATTFTVDSSSTFNGSGSTFVAYLFATCAGVSKVGSYTGNGSTQQINCGFTGGARFVMIKRTDSAGDWIVYSSALGIVAGNDRTVLFNASNASTTFGDTLDALSSGFELGPDSALFNINSNGGTYIFLAIA